MFLKGQSNFIYSIVNRYPCSPSNRWLTGIVATLTQRKLTQYGVLAYRLWTSSIEYIPLIRAFVDILHINIESIINYFQNEYDYINFIKIILWWMIDQKKRVSPICKRYIIVHLIRAWFSKLNNCEHELCSAHLVRCRIRSVWCD